MENLTVYEETDLQKVGIVCPDCGTEAIFDITQEHAAQVSRDCPGCGNVRFIEVFTTEARQNYNRITYYKRGREIPKAVRVRFYFANPE